MDSDQSPDIDAAEKQVEDSREQLDRHLDQLSEKLRPSSLAASALEQINPTDRIRAAVKKPSVLAALLGAAVSLAALKHSRRRRRSK
jgi:hypothetical protein